MQKKALKRKAQNMHWGQESKLNDSRVKLTDEELKNRDKQFKNILAEYQKVKKRLEQVSDGSYTHDLKAKLEL